MRIWDTVRAELSLIGRLLPFVESDLRLPWSTCVHEGGSCGEGGENCGGFAVSYAEWDIADVALHGSWNERSRYKADPSGV